MATVYIIHVFPGFHYYKAGALKCLAQGHSHEKPRGSSAAQMQDPGLRLSHTGPLNPNEE